LIINAAAHTAVDKAESEPELAMRINAQAPAVMAQEAQALGAGMIHYSTDYVFDGSKAGSYDEDDAPHPLNAYGRSKLAGERAVAAACEAHWIFRTSWVYGAHGNNFLKTIVRLAQERTQLNVVADQVGAPTWARRISEVTRCLLLHDARGEASPLDCLRQTAGLYHLTADGAASWYEYACFIVEQLHSWHVPITLDAQAITPISTRNYPTPAHRPLNSRLAMNKIGRTFQISADNWQQDVATCLRDIIGLTANGAEQKNIGTSGPHIR
jgi:dTDP-4-dehydrorhamnose reductase